MIPYKINLTPMDKKLRVADPGILSTFYADDAAFDSLARQSAQLLKLLMEIGPDRGHSPKLANFHFVSYIPR